MELILLQSAALVRPILNIQILEDIGDLTAIAIFALLCLAVFSDAAVRKEFRLAATDLLILAFCAWCLAVYVIYPDHSYIKELAKIVIPLLTYTVAKNVIKDKRQYLSVIRVAIAGFALPIVISAVMIALGKGLESVNYWTGARRFGGAFAGGHSLGHNMTLFLMTLTVFIAVRNASEGVEPKRNELHPAVKAMLYGLVGLSVYCLFMSRVRTAIFGLLVFAAICLLVYNKRILIVGVIAAVGVTVLFWPQLEQRFFPDVVEIQLGRADVSELGSGRLGFWGDNLEKFASLQLDQQLGGIGIGAQNERTVHGIWDSHNDYLDVLLQTGIVGFALFVALQVVFFRRILRITGKERTVFLALFAAVTVMNLVSNSYVARFGLAQIYYLILGYIELPSRSESIETALIAGGRFVGPENGSHNVVRRTR